jgi:sRNA-binding protein
MSSDTRWVTVDRVSASGNPVSEEQINGSRLIVYGGEPGKRYRVRVLRHCGAWTGGILKPSHEEHRRAVEQRKRRERRIKRKKRQKSKPGGKKAKRSAKQKKRRKRARAGAPGGRVGSWSSFRTPKHKNAPTAPKQTQRPKKTTASESLQHLGKRLGGTSVTSQQKSKIQTFSGPERSSAATRELRKRAGRHQ